MSRRIQSRFHLLRQQGRKALIPFVTAGDPNPEVTLPLMQALVTSGADIIELGVPFSDPMADGPIIQRAGERALQHRVNLRLVLDLVRDFRRTDNSTPVVLMGYLNPIEMMGYETFADQAAAAGVDGVLVVDSPPEEGTKLLEALNRYGIAHIFLIAPTTSDDRIASICTKASGFVYYVSIKGVTGAAHLDLGSIAEKLSTIRGFTDLPLGVGFGIKDAATAAAIAAVADAVIVGSAIVKRIEDLTATPLDIPTRIGAFVTELRRAMDATTLGEPGA